MQPCRTCPSFWPHLAQLPQRFHDDISNGSGVIVLTNRHTDPQTLLKTIPTLICYRCTGIDTCDRKTVPTIVEWIKNCRTHQYLPPTMEQHCLNRMKNSLQIYTNHSTTTNTRLQTRIDNNHDNTHEPVPERLVISGFLMARGGCQESPNLASHCMTASWACSSHTKKPKIWCRMPFLPQPIQFTRDWDQPTVCWIAHSRA